MYGQEVNQVQTQFLPESNEYLIRYFGHDGELVEELRMAADVATPPHRLELDRDGMLLVNDSGETLWHSDGFNMYAQGTSSAGYRAATNINIEDIFGPFDTDPAPGFTESEYQMYLDLEVGAPTDRYTDITYGGGSSVFHTRRRDYFEKIFCNGDWGNVEEQPDIEAECGGALDEFLEEFKPQKTNPDRSDEQE